MNKWILILGILFISIQTSMAFELCVNGFGICNPDLPQINPDLPSTSTSINGSTLNVNNSQYLQGLTPQQVADLKVLNDTLQSVTTRGNSTTNNVTFYGNHTEFGNCSVGASQRNTGAVAQICAGGNPTLDISAPNSNNFFRLTAGSSSGGALISTGYSFYDFSVSATAERSFRITSPAIRQIKMQAGSSSVTGNGQDLFLAGGNTAGGTATYYGGSLYIAGGNATGNSSRGGLIYFIDAYNGNKYITIDSNLDEMNFSNLNKISFSNINLTNISLMCNSTGSCFTLSELNASSSAGVLNYTNIAMKNQTNNFTQSNDFMARTNFYGETYNYETEQHYGITLHHNRNYFDGKIQIATQDINNYLLDVLSESRFRIGTTGNCGGTAEECSNFNLTQCAENSYHNGNCAETWSGCSGQLDCFNNYLTEQDCNNHNPFCASVYDDSCTGTLNCGNLNETLCSQYNQGCASDYTQGSCYDSPYLQCGSMNETECSQYSVECETNQVCAGTINCNIYDGQQGNCDYWTNNFGVCSYNSGTNTCDNSGSCSSLPNYACYDLDCSLVYNSCSNRAGQGCAGFPYSNCPTSFGCGVTYPYFNYCYDGSGGQGCSVFSSGNCPTEAGCSVSQTWNSCSNNITDCTEITVNADCDMMSGAGCYNSYSCTGSNVCSLFYDIGSCQAETGCNWTLSGKQITLGVEGNDNNSTIQFDTINTIFTNQNPNGYFIFKYDNQTNAPIIASNFITQTEVNNDINVLETFNSTLINSDGTINHKAYGECYEIIYKTDYSRPKDVMINGKKHTTYPYNITEEGVDLSCLSAKYYQTNSILNKVLTILNNNTLDVSTSILAEALYTKSKVIDANTDYTSKFKNKSDYTNKTKNPSYVVIVNNETGERIGTLDVENRIVNLEGYATDEMQCLRIYTKYDDYRNCMLGVLPKK